MEQTQLKQEGEHEGQLRESISDPTKGVNLGQSESRGGGEKQNDFGFTWAAELTAIADLRGFCL